MPFPARPFFSFIRITSRGVLQNARRVRRKARLMQSIINRAFLKTPLLAADGALGLQTQQDVFHGFYLYPAIGPKIGPRLCPFRHRRSAEAPHLGDGPDCGSPRGLPLRIILLRLYSDIIKNGRAGKGTSVFFHSSELRVGAFCRTPAVCAEWQKSMRQSLTGRFAKRPYWLRRRALGLQMQQDVFYGFYLYPAIGPTYVLYAKKFPKKPFNYSFCAAIRCQLAGFG